MHGWRSVRGAAGDCTRIDNIIFLSLVVAKGFLRRETRNHARRQVGGGVGHARHTGVNRTGHSSD